jgi:hypothetical protein
MPVSNGQVLTCQTNGDCGWSDLISFPLQALNSGSVNEPSYSWQSFPTSGMFYDGGIAFSLGELKMKLTSTMLDLFSGTSLRFGENFGSNTITISPPINITSTYSLTLPPAPPASNGQVLSCQTSGVCSWEDGSISFPLLATDNQTPQYSWASSPDSGMYLKGANIPAWSNDTGERMYLENSFLYLARETSLRLQGSDDKYVGFIAPFSVSESYTLTLPNAPPASGSSNILTSTTNGTLSWSQINTVPANGTKDLPSIKFSTSDATGFFKPDTHTVSVTNNGNETLRISEGGQLQTVIPADQFSRLDMSDAKLQNLVGGTVLYNTYGCRAWGTVHITPYPEHKLTVSASGNVSNVVRNHGGEYSIVFEQELPDAFYSIGLSGEFDSLFTSGPSFTLSWRSRLKTAFVVENWAFVDDNLRMNRDINFTFQVFR